MNAENQTTERGYSFGMRLMHWITAAAMLFVILAGLAIGNDIKIYDKLYDHHRAMGFLLLFIVTIRIVVKFFSKDPSPLPDTITTWQKNLSGIVHHLLYAALIFQPLLGWYATNAWGVKKIPFFFGMHLPQIVEKDRALGNYLLDIHHKMGMAIAVLVLVHIAAALFHHFILKDRVLHRMLKT